MHTLTLGIDSGLSGALAVYDLTQNSVTSSLTIPTFMIERNGKNKRALDFSTLLRGIKETHADSAWIEQLWERPREAGMFTFGGVYYALKMALTAAAIPFSEVSPMKWKKGLLCPADKDGALLRASQLMPASIAHWAPIRGERDKEACKGIAEAALIAYYGARQNLS